MDEVQVYIDQEYLDDDVSELMKSENLQSNESLNKMSSCIDFVLECVDTEDEQILEKRSIFEDNLNRKGLILSEDDKTYENTRLLYIEAPKNVLLKYAELLKLRMPMAIAGAERNPSEDNIWTNLKNGLKKIIPCNLEPDRNIIPKIKNRLTAEFSRDKKYLFNTNSKTFFTNSDRCMLVNYILERESYSNNEGDSKCIGIKSLLSENVYKAAYPLHDDLNVDKCDRKILLQEWANVRKWYKSQPIDTIKDYFGVKIALYFAWLGFYTYVLIPPAIFGLFCFLYGWVTLPNDIFSQEICDPAQNITMCPQCDVYCDYWDVTEACTYAKITHLYDNNLTVFFAICMSIWSALYMNLWKGYSAEIVHRWGLSNLAPEAEHARPEYLARLKNVTKTKINRITEMEEPKVPFWKLKLPTVLLSFSVALFWVSLLMTALLGLLVYRVSAITSEELFKEDSKTFKTLIVPISAAIIDLLCILMLNVVYNYVAVWLTNQELLRTQTEYDDSLTLKIFMFQFLNYYSSFFYIAFIKGRLVGSPNNYTRFFGNRQEECSPGGCLMELCIQLAIVMVGDQFVGQIQEYGVPFVSKYYKKCQNKRSNKHQVSEDNPNRDDHHLLEWPSTGLFDEYLEMVVQYGFVTLFVTAFPLAPLFALLNNIIEIRFDARKFLSDYRRPVAQTVDNIGIWLKIIDVIGKIAIVSNGFIIAFSSNFIPQLVYKIYENPDHTEAGFLNYSLANFDPNDFQAGSEPSQQLLEYNVTECRYPDYRNPPSHEHKYGRSKRFWNILAARVLFVLLYQNVVVICKMIVKWTVPEIPRRLKAQIMKETWHACKIIIEQDIKHDTIKKFKQKRKNNTTNKKPTG